MSIKQIYNTKDNLLIVVERYIYKRGHDITRGKALKLVELDVINTVILHGMDNCFYTFDLITETRLEQITDTELIARYTDYIARITLDSHWCDTLPMYRNRSNPIFQPRHMIDVTERVVIIPNPALHVGEIFDKELAVDYHPEKIAFRQKFTIIT